MDRFISGTLRFSAVGPEFVPPVMPPRGGNVHFQHAVTYQRCDIGGVQRAAVRGGVRTAGVGQGYPPGYPYILLLPGLAGRPRLSLDVRIDGAMGEKEAFTPKGVKVAGIGQFSTTYGSGGRRMSLSHSSTSGLETSELEEDGVRRLLLYIGRCPLRLPYRTSCLVYYT